ncbi:hypothetical protein, partial [Paraburkholderia sp. SIMBA_054]|uniref:hypothetical protein n=1 Tax=Paraburkholderia sp. SIMBA_054 TaxID=3085795 RepID=UPI00397E23C7
MMRLRGGLVVAFVLVPARRGRCRLGLLAFLRWHPRIAFVLRALPFGVLGFSLASALWCLMFRRRPCAGRHLLFFAAAKKSRQKKA